MTADTPEKFAAAKKLASSQEWMVDENGHYLLVCALDDEDGVTIEGMLM